MVIQPTAGTAIIGDMPTFFIDGHMAAGCTGGGILRTRGKIDMARKTNYQIIQSRWG